MLFLTLGGIAEDTVALIIWSAVEMCVTMICIGIPILRPLYRRIRYGSPSSTSEGSYQRQGEDSSLGPYELGGMTRTPGKSRPSAHESKLGIRTQTITDIQTSNGNNSDEHILSSGERNNYRAGNVVHSKGIYVEDDVKVEWNDK